MQRRIKKTQSREPKSGRKQASAKAPEKSRKFILPVRVKTDQDRGGDIVELPVKPRAEYANVEQGIKNSVGNPPEEKRGEDGEEKDFSPQSITSSVNKPGDKAKTGDMPWSTIENSGSNEIWRDYHGESAADEESAEEKEGRKKDAKIENDKKLIMYSGIAFFMVLIIGVWLLNLKSVFRADKTDNADNTKAELNEISDKFSETLDQMKQDLADIKSQAISSSTEPIAESAAPSVIMESNLPQNQDTASEQIEKLKEKLEKKESDVNPE